MSTWLKFHTGMSGMAAKEEWRYVFCFMGEHYQISSYDKRQGLNLLAMADVSKHWDGRHLVSWIGIEVF